MGLRALLLSPDDQAVNAITGVLEELSVCCERPLDGASAAKKLNCEHFDLVLVDCENLPAAKLIFDVCRRSLGVATVPVAIVDGRVGLPTAFRLGAELILTKPVAKDQARVTVRTAVGRIKKEQPSVDVKAAEVHATTVSVQERQNESPAPRAMAAAAGVTSSSTSALVPPASPVTPVATTPPAVPAATATPVAPAGPKPPTAAIVKSTPVMSSTRTLNAEAAELFEATTSVEKKPEPATKAGDSSTSLKIVSGARASKSDASKKVEQEFAEAPAVKALESDEPSSPTPIFSAYEQPKKRQGSGKLITVLVLALLGGGFYAAWMYQPAFHQFMQARLSEANALLGPEAQKAMNAIAGSSGSSTPATAKPAPAPASAAKSAVPAAPTQAAAPATPATSVAENQAAAPAASTPSAAAVPTAAVPANTAQNPVEEKTVAESAPQVELPEVKNTVILSSKGAEKRLLHRVAPVVSPAVRAQSAEATVVLKAVIDERGAVKALQPLEGDTALADAAMKAVEQWRYKPYIRDGKALPFQTIVLVDFQ
jgi:hypothetical protein